jgi:hypothetical protein
MNCKYLQLIMSFIIESLTKKGTIFKKKMQYTSMLCHKISSRYKYEFNLLNEY